MSKNMLDEQHIFNNRYRLDSKLGEGGMATVYCGTDTLLRRRVAIKVLRPDYASDEEFVRRFYQEAESAARLNHPNIVNTYDVGREGDTYFIVMELVDGASLADIIASDGKLPETVAIDYAAQVCNGLAYAHRQGLLHRDIKPANILITKDDVVKLSDFGIARAVSQQTMAMTRPGLVMGSVYYLSPEQAQGRDLHETSDLYSVGIVLYQMLTGKLPYSGDSPVAVALKHVSEPVPSIDPEESGVSPALAAIVNKLLQKQPEHRFQSASEVASALREARERPSFAAYPVTSDVPARSAAPQPPARPSRYPDRPTTIVEDEEPGRRSFLPIIALALAGLLIAGVAGYFASTGNPFSPVPTVKMRNVVGMSDSAAQAAIINAGFQLKPIVREPSSSVAQNHVIRQDPAAGSQVRKDTAVQIVVSSGPPVVELRDVVGYTLADAQKDLNSDKLQVKIVGKFDPAPKDTVIQEKPSAGTKLREGSGVTLIVSQGTAPVKMPKLEGLTLDRARTLAATQGFTINVSETAPIPNTAANVIASQDVAPGTSIPSNHTVVVNVVVSSGGGLTKVPDVIGSDLVSAEHEIRQAGFDVSLNYVLKPSSADNGQIIGEDPASGTPAERGSAVRLMLSVPGAVPDISGMSLAQAKTQLEDSGYQIGNITPTTQGADGKVVRTEPEAGTNLTPGSPVNIYVNSSNARPPK